MPSTNSELEILIKAQTGRAVREINLLTQSLARAQKQFVSLNTTAARDKRLLNALDTIGKASKKLAQYSKLPNIASGAATRKASGIRSEQRQLVQFNQTAAADENSQAQTTGEPPKAERDLLASELGKPYEEAQQSLENYTAVMQVAQEKLFALRNLERGGGGLVRAEQQEFENQIALQEYILEQARRRIATAQELLGITSDTTGELAEQQNTYTNLSSLIHITGTGYDEHINAALKGLDALVQFDQESIKLAVNSETTWKEKINGLAAIAGSASSVISDLVTKSADTQFNETQDRLAGLQEQIQKEKDSQEDRIAVLDALGQDSVAWQLENNQKIREDEAKLKEERTQAELENFNVKKNAALTNAIIQGALGVVTAFTAPFPMSLVLAGIAAATAGAQIAAISSQQPPALATGGIVPAQPPYGGLYRIGEQQSEAVIPLDKFGLGNQGGTVVYNYYNTTVQGSIIESDVARQLDTAITEVDSKIGVAHA